MIDSTFKLIPTTYYKVDKVKILIMVIIIARIYLITISSILSVVRRKNNYMGVI